MRLLIPLAVLACLVAGCGAPVAGTPTTPAAGPSAAPSTTAVPDVVLPPRPRSVDLTGVDPCALLTADQRKQLGLDTVPSRDQFRSALYNGGLVPTCTTLGFEPRAIATFVSISTSGGVEVYAARPIRGTATPISVRGFPAVQASQTDHAEFCTVVVDVSAGQALDIQFRDGGDKPPVPQTDLCAGAKQTAELAMTTLTTTLGR